MGFISCFLLPIMWGIFAVSCFRGGRPLLGLIFMVILFCHVLSQPLGLLMLWLGGFMMLCWCITILKFLFGI